MSVSPEEVMSAVSPDLEAIARKSYTKIAQRLQPHGSQKKVAQAVGISESAVSRLADGQLEQFCAVLASLGLRVEDVNHICVDPRNVEFSIAAWSRLLQHKDAPYILSGFDPESASLAARAFPHAA